MPWSKYFECWVLSQLFTLLFQNYQEPFSSSSHSAISAVSSAYPRLLTFLLAILIPACASSSLEFHMIYSAYKLNKQGDNVQPWRTPSPIWNQSVVPYPVNCCFLTCIQISQEVSKVFWYFHLLKNFPQFVVIYTNKMLCTPGLRRKEQWPQKRMTLTYL